MRLHEKNSLFLGKKTNSKIIVTKASHFSLRILLSTLVAVTVLIGGTSICFGSLIYNNDKVAGITGIDFLGESYDVTFGVESYVEYIEDKGWKTVQQTSVDSEDQLPIGTGCDFLQIVAEELSPSGSAKSVYGASRSVEFNVTSDDGLWHLYTLINDMEPWWINCDNLDAFLKTDWSGTMSIALITRSPVPEPATALLFLAGIGGCYIGCRKKRLP
jgi:hypothetical protein